MKEKFINAHMRAAFIYSELSYCKKRQVGCVIVKDDKIISIGFNGTPSGWDNICEDASGQSLPHVIHAESNAIAKLAASNESGKGASIFTTTAPCIACAKLIALVGIDRVYYFDRHHTDEGLDFLAKCGIETVKVHM